MKATKLLEFRVTGVAQPRGSKKAITVPGQTRGLLIDDNRKSGPWMQVVKQAATEAMQGRQPFDGPLCLKVIVFRARPKGHHGTKGNVLPSAPAFPATRPDASKYMRAIEDAMSKVVYGDDGQLVDSWPSKRFGEPGIVVQLFRLPQTVAELRDEF